MPCLGQTEVSGEDKLQFHSIDKCDEWTKASLLPRILPTIKAYLDIFSLFYLSFFLYWYFFTPNILKNKSNEVWLLRNISCTLPFRNIYFVFFLRALLIFLEGICFLKGKRRWEDWFFWKPEMTRMICYLHSRTDVFIKPNVVLMFD